MALIMLTIWYPASKAEEMGKTYLEVRKTPLDRSIMKRILPMGIRIVKDGFRNVSIYEVKPGKVEDALAYISKRILAFSKIEGWQSEVEVLMSGAEAMPLIGLKMPE